MKNILAKFDYNRFYHVFNRTNNREILFRNNENKRYFLKLVHQRLFGYVNFYAYALLGNHFHFAVSIPSEEKIVNHLFSLAKEDRKKSEVQFLESNSEERDVHKFISIQWSRVFNSYTQSINKRYKRNGHLFHAPFKRFEIDVESRFTQLIYYIHHNSRKHRLVNDFLSDPWHSYENILSNEDPLLESQFVLNWFGGRDAFIEYHAGKHLERELDEENRLKGS